MAQHKSAIKRARQSEKRRQRNQHTRSGLRTQVKRLRQALESGDVSAAGESIQAATKALQKAASQGLIPKRRADRSVGRLARSLHALRQKA